MRFFSLGRPEADAVLRHGTSHRGHITGIRVSYTRDDPPARIDDFAVAVGTPEGMQIHGIRQRLRPDDLVRLGLPVLLRVEGKAAIIDWKGTCGLLGGAGDNVTDGWKPLKEPPYEGVADAVLDLDRAQRKGEPARVTISAVGERSAAFDLHLTVRVAGGDPSYDTLLTNVRVPFYARHLCVEGSELPAYVRSNRSDRVDIDWPTAARNFMAIEAARRG